VAEISAAATEAEVEELLAVLNEGVPEAN